MSAASQDLQKFAPFQSFVQDTFWHKLAEVKLEEDRLSDAPRPIFGFYTNRNAKDCLLEVDYNSFKNYVVESKFYHPSWGTLYNKNTIEEFKECDKSVLLHTEGQQLLAHIKSGQILDNPCLLSRFCLLSFADIKCHSFYYWFAFPCPLIASLKSLGPAKQLRDVPELKVFEALLTGMPREMQSFFVLKANDKSKLYTLKEALADGVVTDDYYFGFADPSEFEQPAWCMRTYAAFIYYQCPSLVGKTVKFLGVRLDNQTQAGQSLVWHVQQNEPIDLNEENMKFVGWEPNRQQKMAPRFVNMAQSMDPAKLAEASMHLNLKLMKWRQVPDLNLKVIEHTKVLLFGAGTLGCAVARNLLGWGFKHLTFLDSGHVSFANPVRQCLYTYADAMAGNLKKAHAAVMRIKEIDPNTNVSGHAIQIPMPGHTIGENQRAQVGNDLQKIETLVQEHDVLFLLTDSRESRWLPTLLGAALNKIVINSALGFDSYVVMRHGGGETMPSGSNVDISDLKCIPGSELGCYFCNDVIAPGNSLRERTLDQQCTVTRPGVSNIAASYAVELLVSLLQHPLGAGAPAYYSLRGESASNTRMPEGLLGILPHSIRGMLCNYENILPASQKFTQCIACSEEVLNAYAKEGNAFLFKAFESSKYLEDLTGITAYRDLNSEVIDFDDSGSSECEMAIEEQQQ